AGKRTTSAPCIPFLPAVALSPTAPAPPLLGHAPPDALAPRLRGLDRPRCPGAGHPTAPPPPRRGALFAPARDDAGQERVDLRLCLSRRSPPGRAGGRGPRPRPARDPAQPASSTRPPSPPSHPPRPPCPPPRPTH